MNFCDRFSDASNRMRPSSIHSVFYRMKPGSISFAGGMPAYATFPVEHIKAITSTMLDKYGPESMQYAGTEGFQPLREWIASQIAHADADNVQIISGSQQVISLMGNIFINPGDKIAISAPTYTIDNLTIEDTNTPEDYDGPFLFTDPDAINVGHEISALDERAFLYEPCHSVKVQNLAVASGKKFRISPNAELKRQVTIIGA